MARAEERHYRYPSIRSHAKNKKRYPVRGPPRTPQWKQLLERHANTALRKAYDMHLAVVQDWYERYGKTARRFVGKPLKGSWRKDYDRVFSGSKVKEAPSRRVAGRDASPKPESVSQKPERATIYRVTGRDASSMLRVGTDCSGIEAPIQAVSYTHLTLPTICSV